MAPETRPAAAEEGILSSSAPSESFRSWLAEYGDQEYALYKKTTATSHLSHEEWAASEHVLGPYLYRITLNAWDEASSSDDEVDLSATPTSPDQPARLPARSVTTQRRRSSQAANSSTPKNGVDTPDFSASSAKRQRRKKKFLSDAIIPREEIDDFAVSHAKTTPEGRGAFVKQRMSEKKSSSIHSIAPEDIQEHTPVADAASSGPSASTPDGPASASSSRRGLRTRTPAQQRPYFHHQKLFEEQTEDGVKSKKAHKSPPKLKSRLSEVFYPEFEGESSDPELESVPERENHDLPDEEDDHLVDGEPVTYMSEDDEDLEPLPALSIPLSPPPHREKKFKGKGRAWKKDEEDEDDDYAQKPKKPKPKGPLQKKRASLPLQQEARDVPASTQGTNGDGGSPTLLLKQKAKPGRKPKKAHLSEEFVQEDSDTDMVDESIDARPAAQEVESQESEEESESSMLLDSANTPAAADRPKRKPRRSYLSQEFVGDESGNDNAEVVANNKSPAKTPKTAAAKSSLERRPSDPSAAPIKSKSADSSKQKRRSRKSFVSQEFVNEDSESDAPAEQSSSKPKKRQSLVVRFPPASPKRPSLIVKLRTCLPPSSSPPSKKEKGKEKSTSTPTPKRRPRGRPRKSEEFVHSDSEAEDNQLDHEAKTESAVREVASAPPKTPVSETKKKAAKPAGSSTGKRGRPRKSEVGRTPENRAVREASVEW